MAYKRRSSGAWVDAANIKRRASGAWVGVTAVKRRVSGAWVTVWPPAATALINDQYIYHDPPSGPAQAGYRLNASGVVEQRLDTTYSTLETWLLSGAAADYQVRATVVSGAIQAGTTGSWLSLSTSPEWRCTKNSPGSQAATLTVEIRLASTGVVQDTASIILEAIYA